ncbi:MAG: PA2778 family cysteine peptidase [Chromatiales bacterium]|nr:PA2778 family cysteine peptidase [Chromatiales bacterium]
MTAKTAARAALTALAASTWLAACTGIDQLVPEDPGHELTQVPFFPQTIHQCGPAALATVLGTSGVNATPEQLAPLVYIPGRRGSLQVEMLAAARSRGRVAYVIEPAFSAVQAELAAGTPVLVLQDLGALGIRRWHFAVVIGFDPERDVVILRSGTRRRHILRRSDFLRTWQAGSNWAAVVTPPERPPATATGSGFIRALADTERNLPRSAVEAGHAAALERWPADPLVLLANGNDAYASQRLADAIRLYRDLLANDPGNVAGRNNLANALLDAGCARAALAEAQQAAAQLGPEAPLGEPVRDTLEKATAAAGSDDSLCSAE